jgi:hypothetical protein
VWQWAKLLLAVAIIGGVGWQFAQILNRPEFWDNPPKPRPGWIGACVGFYVLAFSFPAFYWFHLLRVLGERPPVAGAWRAYYVGHLGKYVPFKAWALVLRTVLIQPHGVRPAVAVMTAIYETMTFIAAGALVAALLLTMLALQEGDLWLAAALLVAAGLPIIPGVYNRIVDRLTVLARKAAARQSGAPADIADLPRVRVRTLLFGLAWTAWAWPAMGLSLWAILQAVLPGSVPWSWEFLGRCTAYVALAYVAGFLAIPAPGGLGIRELLLLKLLTPELTPLVGSEAEKQAAAVVLLLRLVYIVTELIMAGVTSLLPGARAVASSAVPEKQASKVETNNVDSPSLTTDP